MKFDVRRSNCRCNRQFAGFGRLESRSGSLKIEGLRGAFSFFVKNRTVQAVVKLKLPSPQFLNKSLEIIMELLKDFSDRIATSLTSK